MNKTTAGFMGVHRKMNVIVEILPEMTDKEISPLYRPFDDNLYNIRISSLSRGFKTKFFIDKNYKEELTARFILKNMAVEADIVESVSGFDEWYEEYGDHEMDREDNKKAFDIMVKNTKRLRKILDFNFEMIMKQLLR
jgi:hypothetical protein